MTLEHLIPHRPPFRLIDTVLEQAPESVVAQAVVDSNNVFFDASLNAVPSWTAIEYMAQTAAVWVGLHDAEKPGGESADIDPSGEGGEQIRPAFLISARQLQVQQPSFALGATLRIHVDVNFIDGPIVAFHGTIMQCVDGVEQRVCEGEFSAFRPDSLEEYLQASDPQRIAQAGQLA
ncbi:hypothetical protein QWI17_18215 [Gilvimarinus sp. SDUM040013]|uniref:3-hydroxylacyl-ACP dehydratase n=1 Tax=Gilvimarinus gilvus TaxID=3058038 RepID=A0ABU4S594_9GAMM|nr:hypothetical protein [Gilvimarinus sp. SDUM040013]MDO3387784.1 hypothetical protein [Gilvimarinus sp. SDUM040013]MDX6851073.1 hypothetical protein [Gilvimarinus sp. SDUM040013]